MGKYASIAAALTVTVLPGLLYGAPRDGVPRDGARVVVDNVATIIENNYFDAGKAREIAASLRAAAQAGAYDNDTDPRDLASKLTGKLQPVDHHFLVRWVDASQATPGGETELADRRYAYGFRRVEMLPGGIGYLDLSYFADFDFNKPDEPARRTADAALALLANADAVIIDLRNNGGGSPAMVGYLVSAFTPPGADIYNTFRHRDRNDSERPKVPYPNPRLDVPLYVLISGRTASAAESAAYTLQAPKRARIIGAPSGGASNPGGEFPVDGGYTIFVSTSTAINPITGTNWEGAGVRPDVRTAASEALESAERLALEAILAQHPDALEARWILEALKADRAPENKAKLTEYAGDYTGARIAEENGHLELRRGRRPPWVLQRLRDDVFFVKGEPYRRVIFARQSGRITHFQLVRADGPATWFARAQTRAPRASGIR
ncbi:MAG TPA: S41 family peptidase [Steroidobacteraceae bacterium]|nr:S41 family peptidase [Steroidobacteraceae bacterium]